jgi:hypothetical protein
VRDDRKENSLGKISSTIMTLGLIIKKRGGREIEERGEEEGEDTRLSIL